MRSYTSSANVRSGRTSIARKIHGVAPAYLEVLRPHSTHIRDPEHETYGVEDVGLARPIEPGDGVEALIPATDDGANGIRLEAVND
jgi:hypothetical protein